MIFNLSKPNLDKALIAKIGNDVFGREPETTNQTEARNFLLLGKLFKDYSDDQVFTFPDGIVDHLHYSFVVVCDLEDFLDSAANGHLPFHALSNADNVVCVIITACLRRYMTVFETCPKTTIITELLDWFLDAGYERLFSDIQSKLLRLPSE